MLNTIFYYCNYYEKGLKIEYNFFTKSDRNWIGKIGRQKIKVKLVWDEEREIIYFFINRKLW